MEWLGVELLAENAGSGPPKQAFPSCTDRF